MAGFIQDPLQIINLIGDNLRDRYKSGFPVLKEIIQNADDAGNDNTKIKLEYGLVCDLPDAEHPLLRTPALFFLNNGSFSKSDSRAIRSFGLNQKAMDTASIGKFGLGMKSVFHFCEAFFFLAQDNDKKMYEEILNPWSGSEDSKSFHEEWDKFSKEDAHRMRSHLSKIFDAIGQDRKSYFLLWLPLRKEKHLEVKGKKVGSIISEFPGDDKQLLAFLDDERLPQKLAALLPLLKRLESIRYWQKQETGQFNLKFSIYLKNKAVRITRPEKTQYPLSIKGMINYSVGTNEPCSQIYSGKEYLLISDQLKALRNSSHWPKSYVRNEQGEQEQAPDKAKPHCAVVFLREPAIGRTELSICWAVFLPVETEAVGIQCKGDISFRLVLHGYFFVDAGRVTIEGLQNSSFQINLDDQPTSDIQKRWNKHLAEQGTLPLILPALAKFVLETKLSTSEIENLCAALKKSNLFTCNRKIICKEKQWVCTVTPHGQEWKLVPKDRKILSLPVPPKSALERPWKTFRKLMQLDKNVTFISDKAPHLLETAAAKWNESDLETLLDLSIVENFSDQNLLKYMLDFLSNDAVKPVLGDLSIQTKLQQILKEAFIKFDNALYKCKGQVQKYASFIQQEKRYVLKKIDMNVLSALQLAKTDCLVVSKEFDDPTNCGNAVLSDEDCRQLLKKLHELILKHNSDTGDSAIISSCLGTAKEIFNSVDDDNCRELLRNSARQWKILEGYDCKIKSSVPLSAKEIETCHDNRLLFRYSQGPKIGLSSDLQNVIEDRVLLISEKIAEWIFEKNNDLKPCDENGVLFAIGTKLQLLDSIKKRCLLLKKVAGVDLFPEEIRLGLRYLLHNCTDKFNDESTLWVQKSDQYPVWEKLWRTIEDNRENPWNLLDRKLVEEIPQKKWCDLNIKEIQPQEILRELDKNTKIIIPAKFAFNEDERNTILREVDDEKLWKRLPFHETEKGDLVEITEKSYRKAKISLPDTLRDCVDMLKRSNDKRIQRQQKDWIPSLSSNKVIKIILDQDNPEFFWQEIMNNLSKDINSSLTESLMETPWLIASDKTPIKPLDVIVLENMEDDVDRILSGAQKQYISPKKLYKEIQDHSSFDTLKKKYFATGKEGLKKLAFSLGENSKYYIGKVELNEDDFEQIIKTFERLPMNLHLPGWSFLSKLIRLFSLKEIKEYLFPRLKKPIPIKKIIGILDWLKEEHNKVSAKNKKNNILVAFNAYLSALEDAGCTLEELSELYLLNRNAEWKRACELCFGAEGVENTYLLDDKQASLLRNIIFHADKLKPQGERAYSSEELQDEINESASMLKNFFDEWEGLVAPEIICTFLSLLGDEQKMRDLSEKYKGSHSVEWVRDTIPWEVNSHEDKWGKKGYLYGLNANQAIEKHRFIVRCSDGDTANVHSILGETINIPLCSEDELTSLIIDGIKGHGYTVCIKLRKPNTNIVSSTKLSELLRSSAEYLLKYLYKQQDYNLEELWKELDKSDQLDIRVARQLIMENFPFYFRQLGVHKQCELQELLKKWDQNRRKREEYYDSEKKIKEFDTSQRKILTEIQELLKNNEDVQKAVLDAVRAKMEDFQYKLSSIPFELFQNADDAVVELAEIKHYMKNNEDVLPEHVKRFLIITQKDLLTFIHWGRQINAVGSRSFLGEERGFDKDLEKMLVLSSSDKSEDGKVTGKFGLGFKCILLASDRPKLISGRLSLEIIAGLCPIPLENSSGIRKKLTQKSPDKRWQGTLIELPLTKTPVQEIMFDFEQFAGIMTIFSKQIRRIEIDNDCKENQVWEWKPEIIPLSENACLEIGELPLPEKKSLSVHFRFPKGGILIAIGSDGFCKLPRDVPTMWVVAPTQESKGIGFAINGSFDLDAGRARLAGNSKLNKEKVNNLGKLFGKALVELYALSQDKWDDLKERIRLREDLSTYAFWSTFWEIMIKGVFNKENDEINNLITHLLFGGNDEDNGLRYLLSQHDALPNGLWGDFQKLTRPAKIQTVLKGCLCSESIFSGLIKWDFFKNLLKTPHAIISEAIYTNLEKMFRDIDVHTMQLADVFREFAKTTAEISPDTAKIIGGQITSKFLKQDDITKERESVSSALSSLSFKSQDGNFYVAKELLVRQKHNSANPDEAKRATFAPGKYVLSDEYNENGLDFFFACREKISIPVEDIANWIINLTETEEEKREKALRYLLNGEHGEKIAHLLREKGIDGIWLKDLTDKSDCFSEWNQDDITELLRRKLPSTEELRDINRSSSLDFDNDFENEDIADPKTFLSRIWKWWSKDKNKYLARYKKKTYPSGDEPDLKENSSGRIDRSAWMVLFVLGHCHTMGRQRSDQHRSFIELCIDKGWWKVFSTEKPEESSDEWMRVLDEYIDAQTDDSEYEHWMNRFPAIYKISKGLEDYAELLLSLDKYTEIKDIRSILQPSVNPQNQGGGISVPPIDKTLGIGACFVIRELKRYGLLNNSKLTPYCYVPVKRVRELFRRINGSEINDSFEGSKNIYEVICQYLGTKKATFLGNYDIPLQIIAEDEKLRQKMLI